MSSPRRGTSYVSCEVGLSVTGPVGGTSSPPSTHGSFGVSQQRSITSPNYATHTHGLNGVQEMSSERRNGRGEMVVGNLSPRTDPSLTHMNNNIQEACNETLTDELRHLVLTQLEYYFSPDNLSTDKFLVSQMDSDQYVYISTIANFNMIKKLSSDLDLITDVLRESKSVQVHQDGKRVRPISNRTIVILRGIPHSTPIEEIKALFEKDNSPRCNHCEFAFNDSWYLSFESDDEAMRAHRYLREEVREFKGQPIMARIKSRPTTLLGPGVGVIPTKNGYHQPAVSLPTYIGTPYVTASQTGPSTTVSSTPIYHNPQQVSSAVFTMTPNPYGSFGGQLPWAPGFYELTSSLTPLYGMPSGPYQKTTTLQMVPRQRTSKSESSDSSYGPQPGRVVSRRANGNSGTGEGGGIAQINGVHGLRGEQGNAHYSRKTTVTSHAHLSPAPLLAMAPAQTQQTTNQVSMNQASAMPITTIANHNNRNGHLHYSSLPSQPHQDSYHRTYRQQDTRPRSSLGVRRGPRNRDEACVSEGSGPSPLVQGASRGVPSVRSQGPPPASPQPSTQPTSVNHTTVTPNKFDLEVSSFPPLPGAPNDTNKNGDFLYEGRLSDVVKGVKGGKVMGGCEKEELGLLHTGSYDMVVSEARDISCSPIHVVSAASPTLELEMGALKEKRTDLPSSSSHSFPPSSPPPSKKEYREVGVGSADDNHDIRASSSKECFMSGIKGKETADKSTQSIIVKTTSTSTVPTTHTKPFSPSTHNTSKQGPRTDDDSGTEQKEGDSISEVSKVVDENCSSEERLVRLSYAQVAQRHGSEKTLLSSATLPPTHSLFFGDEKKGHGVKDSNSKEPLGRGQTSKLGQTSRSSVYVAKRPSFPNNRRDRVLPSSGGRDRGQGHGSSDKERP